MAESASSPAASPLRGIALKIASVFVFVAMATLIKASGKLPAGQIVFFRSLFAMVPILLVLAWRGELSTAFGTTRPFGHIARGIVGVCAMGLSFFALTRLPLPEAIVLGHAKPLLVVIFSAVFLHEVIRLFRWTTAIVGLIGVVIVSWPKLTLLGANQGVGLDETLGMAAVLASAAFAAVAMLLVRNLVETEKTPTIVLWFSLTATGFSLLTIPFGWQAMTSFQALCLVAAGFCGGFGQILLTQSYRHAEVSTIAPFEYLSILLAIVVGYFAFGDIPQTATIIGGTIIVAAGVLIIYREHRLGLKRGRARPLVTPQG